MTLETKIDEIQKQQITLSERISALEMGNKPNTLTRYAFRSLFSLEELIAITTASKSNVIIEIFMKNMELAAEIDLKNVEVTQGLSYLVSQGIITQEKMNIILSGI